MKIVLLTHAPFSKSKSMPKFSQMLASGLEAENHEVVVCTSPSFFYRLSVIIPVLSKWLGYLDQLILFPIIFKLKLLLLNDNDTLFVFCDQALGPWVPMVKNRPHVIHVHDLLALKSALGLEPINKTHCTGKIYQKYIRKGFERGKVFISVSSKTKQDLEKFTSIKPSISKVIYNGLNYQYKILSASEIIELLSPHSFFPHYKEYLLNVGVNQWYKNRLGLMHLYRAYVEKTCNPLPLVVVGPKPTKDETAVINAIKLENPQAEVTFLYDVSNEVLNALYCGARCTLVPSHEEGFGWPIIESQASGTCIITTDNAPMAEIAGSHSYFLSSTEHYRHKKIEAWANVNIHVLMDFLSLDLKSRQHLEKISIEWASNFSSQKALSLYFETYEEALAKYHHN